MVFLGLASNQLLFKFSCAAAAIFSPLPPPPRLGRLPDQPRPFSGNYTKIRGGGSGFSGLNPKLRPGWQAQILLFPAGEEPPGPAGVNPPPFDTDSPNRQPGQGGFPGRAGGPGRQGNGKINNQIK